MPVRVERSRMPPWSSRREIQTVYPKQTIPKAMVAYAHLGGSENWSWPAQPDMPISNKAAEAMNK